MSYNCVYRLTYDIPDKNTNFVEKLIKQGIEIPNDVRISQGIKSLDWNIQEYIECQDELRHAIDNNGRISWYSWEDDMKSLSNEFPSVLFKLIIYDAEECISPPSIAFFKNGKYYEDYSRVIFPDFDETKLN